MTRLFRRRRMQPLWQLLWRRLTYTQQERIKSISWSASVHLLLLVLLALNPLGIRTLTTISFTASMAEAEAAEVLTLTELVEPAVEELELLEELETHEELNMEEILEPLTFDSPLPTAPPLEADQFGDLPTPSSIAELQSDDSRIVETDRRVKAAGGTLEGPIRISLIFEGDDDIDLHVRYNGLGRPGQADVGQYYVWFNSPQTIHATLDVDANAQQVVRDPCENVIFHSVPKRGSYLVAIHHFMARGRIQPTPYVVTIKYGEKIKVIEGTIMPYHGLRTIWQFQYTDN